MEPTGPIEEDPNLKDRKFRGNPTKAFRSPEPLRITAEVSGWRRSTDSRSVASSRAWLVAMRASTDHIIEERLPCLPKARFAKC